ncbi:uncharacterized protein LOC116182017 isoform X3 [Photinus pyralis]|uniref:uncharacterized protein LOC116182017 isoform X3 n=1 Tax=Photinus pyralis TaxID=7054 RepID=UPI00126758AB|nr:uncharacterized protein LOC116182017 isoform X3 [Photinus pyralis]
MEFRSQDFAQLVLGYLKETRCKRAFLDLLYHSEHLRDHANNYRNRRFVVTRVAGMSLVEYLNEYAAIYTIVQERLEATDFYKENCSRSSLMKQVLYLFDKFDIHSRTSTPIQEIATVNSHNASTNTEPCDVQNISDIGHRSFDHLSISTTPKNTFEDDPIQKSHDKSRETTSTCDKSTTTDNEAEVKEKSHEQCEEIFTNTFLENIELIEKLADNINKEVSSKSSAELDSLAIQSIVQRTESDPILVQLISEIIDTENATDKEASSNQCEQPLTCENTLKITPAQKKKVISPPIEDSIKKRMRSARSQPSNIKDTLIEDQNNDAVESIIAASCLNEEGKVATTSCHKSSTSQSIELLLTTAQCNMHNSIVYTAPGDTNSNPTTTADLLMIQSNTTVSNTQLLPQKAVNVDASRSCFIIGNQPFVNVTLPPTPLKVLSEQDILTMPTIFVCDNTQPYGSTQTVVVPSTAPPPPVTRSLKKIAPKVSSDHAQSIGEYITLYKCNESSPYKATPQKISFTEKELTINTDTYQSITQETFVTKDLQNAVLSNVLHAEQIVDGNLNAVNCENSGLPIGDLPTDKLQTPPVVTTESKEGSNTKSNSHVRQLHFSTPEKLSTRKSERSTSKAVRTSLFKSPLVEEGDNEKQVNSAGKINSCEKLQTKQSKSDSWDSNLRGFTLLPPETKPIETPAKSKRKRPSEDTSQTVSAKKRKEPEKEILIMEVDLPKDNVRSETVDSKPSTSGTSKKAKPGTKKNEKSNVKKSVLQDRKGKKRKGTNKETVNEKISAGKHADDADKPKTENIGLDKAPEIVNRVVKPRINKKCNIDNSKKFPTTDEIILTSVPKIKSCEILKEEESVLILSSKLKQSSGVAIEKENSSIQEEKDSGGLKPTQKVNGEEPRTTVDSVPTFLNLPSLETPMKNCIPSVPKTPAVPITTLVDTPFTKAVIDQLTGVDINSIPTPKFPITPNFAFTPALNSPFSNRGTDYSTSSSYYQPSDSEQNKSLEQLIQECQRLEKQDNVSRGSPDIQKDETVIVTAVQSTTEAQKNEDTIVQKKTQISSIESSFIEKRKAFNENLLGKKNMQLAKMLSDEATDENTSSSESDTSKTSSSSSSEESDSSDDNRSPLKKAPYSLRPRKGSQNTDNPLPSVSKEEPSPTISATHKVEKPHTYQDEMRSKMEEIRQRTIAKIQGMDGSVKPKTPPSKQKAVSKVRKRVVKSAEKVCKPKNDTPKVQEKVTASKSESKDQSLKSEDRDQWLGSVNTLDVPSSSEHVNKIPNTKVPSKNIEIEIKSSTHNVANSALDKSMHHKTSNNRKVNNNSPDVDIILHLSSDDDKLQPYHIVETELRDSSVCSTPTSEHKNENVQEKKSEAEQDKDDKSVDKEAESLVQGLKQWGIHLIPNKLVKNTPSVVDNKEKISRENTGLFVGTSNVKEKPVSTPTNLDSTLEDGEILSPVKKDYKKSKSKSVNLKKDALRNLHDVKKHTVNKTSKGRKKEIPALNKLGGSSKELSKEKRTDSQEKVKQQCAIIKPDFSIKFDTKTFERETLKITHDGNSKSSKKLSDYDFEILNKKFEAYVYIEEIGENVEKLMSFTPFNFIFELSPESSVSRKQPASVKSKDSLVKKKLRPLDTLYKQLVKREPKIHKSPLDNLYSPSSSSRESTSNSNRRSDQFEKIQREHSKSSRKSEKSSEVASNERLQMTRDDKGKIEQQRDKEKNDEKSKESEPDKLIQKCPTTPKSPKIQNVAKSKEKVELQIETLYNSLENADTDQDDTVKTSEDSLMNYAVIGSQRINEDDDLCDERKSAVEQVEQKDEERKEPEVCQLLQNIDVDSFLKQLHGDT